MPDNHRDNIWDNERAEHRRALYESYQKESQLQHALDQIKDELRKSRKENEALGKKEEQIIGLKQTLAERTSVSEREREERTVKEKELKAESRRVLSENYQKEVQLQNTLERLKVTLQKEKERESEIKMLKETIAERNHIWERGRQNWTKKEKAVKEQAKRSVSESGQKEVNLQKSLDRAQEELRRSLGEKEALLKKNAELQTHLSYVKEVHDKQLTVRRQCDEEMKVILGNRPNAEDTDDEE